MATAHTPDMATAAPDANTAEPALGASPAAARPFPTSADDVGWIDYVDSEGESYVFFAFDEEWPGPVGGASRGAP